MRILLVDDDDAILHSLTAVLKPFAGHDVRTATSGEEALKLAEEMGGLDLIVTDVVMDPMDGFALRDAVAERHPGARVILMTGYDLSDYAEQTANHQLLQKPFEPADLLAAVRKDLGEDALVAEAPMPEPPVAAEPPAPSPEPPPAEPTPAEPEPIAPPEAIAPAPEPPAPEPPAPAPPAPQPVAEIAPPSAPEPVAAPSEPESPALPSETPATPEPLPAVAALAAAAPPLPTPAAPAAPAQPVPVARPSTVPQPRQATSVPRPTAVPAPGTARPTAAPGTPVAVPRPTGAPSGNPVAPSGPQARPAGPAAVPVARPAGATPTAVPQARATAPGAVPVARPATPTAAPTARPGVVAPMKGTQPIPKAPATQRLTNVSTQPISAPAAVPAPAAAVAIVAAKAVATTAAAVPVAKVTTAPAALPTAKPAAVPVAKAGPTPAKAAPPVAAAPHAPVPPDTSNLPARNIGAYDIHHRLGEGRWGAVYAAVQTAINRPVALKILDPERAKDETAVQNFTADARAKASVQHPSILAVYEAGEQDGHIFYTREYVAGRNLAEIEIGGTKIDEVTALKVLRVVSEGLAYLKAQNTSHTALEARSIYLGTDGQPRLANLASTTAGTQQTFPEQVQTLGKALLSVLPAAQKLSPGLRNLLGRMVQTAAGNAKSFPDWAPVLQAVKALEPQVVPAAAAQISAGDRAAVAAVEAARKAQQRSIYLTVGSGISLLVLVGVLVWFFVLRGGERDHDEMVNIPAGDFLFQNGEPATVPEFWIDKYEVTNGQYAEFVDYLEDHPRGQYPEVYDKIEHPNQPPMKRVDGGHRPPNWHIFYPRAKGKMEVAGTPTTLDSPVVEVDWWSAYAYAKWRGRDLPTEQEWEKAARGTKGFLYPWGEQPDPKRCNSGADYHEGNPSAKAEIDGFIRYGDVDLQKDDVSAFGVIGTAGNVSEWINDWAIGADKRTKYPMIKGGNFRDPNVKLDKRILAVRPDATLDWLGFRTVSHTAPKK